MNKVTNWSKLSRLIIGLSLFSFLLGGCIQSEPEEKTIIVTSPADSGPGTLRQALLDAQSGDTISFDAVIFPTTAPATIYVSSELPTISVSNLTIDASNAGVILDGSNISGDFIMCLHIISDGNVVRGLQLINFPGTGIGLTRGAQHNLIGGDRRIGSGPLGQGNLVSRGRTGISLGGNGNSFNTITGNLIGTDASGADDWGNSGCGIGIEGGASHNTIGPDNIIAYNEPVPQRSSKNENGRHCTIAQSGNDLSVGDLMRYSQYFLTSVGE